MDWAAKRALLADYVEAEGIPWDDESLPSFDLAYSSIDPEDSLYYALEEAGEMVRLTSDAAIDVARLQAPPTRAAIRGLLVSRFADKIGSVSWNRVILRSEAESWMANLDQYLTPDDVTPLMKRLVDARTIDDLTKAFPGEGV